MDLRSKISGWILAGGRGTRMGRVDKGLQPFRGATLAEHVVRRLAPQVAGITINANRSLPQYQAITSAAGYGNAVVPDQLSGYEGPLAGLQTGLQQCSTELLLTAPCDSPLLPPDLAQRLYDAMQAEDADVAVAVTMESEEGSAELYRQLHPVFSLFKASVRPQLDAYLATGARRMESWLGTLRVAEVLFEDASAFRNINTLTELQAMERSAPADAAACDNTDHLPDTGTTAAGDSATATTVAAAAAAAAQGTAGSEPALPVAEAQRLINDCIQPVDAGETLFLRSVLGRVLARNVISPINVPAYDNSAMDGYALRGADLPAEGDAPVTFKVAGIAYAGRPCGTAIGKNECVRIMTGACIPPGCDSVLPQELAAAIGEGTVTIVHGAIRAGDNRRFAGEDLKAGSPALHKGRILRPSDLGLLASLGIGEVQVKRRLRVAFFSTGDELRSLGQELDTGCVYDSNRYTLYGMLERLGCDPIDMGIVRDDPASLESALRSACAQADAIITSGGVSEGAADYTRDIMRKLGDVAFWKLAMRPGRPLAFGQIRADDKPAWLFGLPGNPVAVMVSFYFFARPALLRMMGVEGGQQAPLMLRAQAQAPIRKRSGRTEFQRGVITREAGGEPQVRLTGAQGSGILRSMSEANCIVVLPQDQGNVAAGDMVDVIPFEGLI